MSNYTTKPVKELNKTEFKIIIKDKEIVISPHAYDHLSSKQRKIFKDEEIFNMIRKENPRKIYLQVNGRYSAYYRKKDGYRKLIISIENNNVIVVSFMDPPEIPKIRL